MTGELAIAEVPGAIWVPAHAARYHARPAGVVGVGYRRVVIHITSGHPDPMGTAQMWQGAPAKPADATAAHFVCGSDKLIQAVALRYAANHAHAANGDSVGVEHTARKPGEWGKTDAGLAPTPDLYVRSARLVAWLLKAAGLPVVKGLTLLGHAEADPQTTHADCPDSVWDWPYYLGMVNQAYAAIGGATNVA